MIAGDVYRIRTEHYREMSQLAAKIAIENGIVRYPINPMRLAAHYKIKVITYPEFQLFSNSTDEELLRISPDGFSVFINGRPLIVYNHLIKTKGRRRWTLIHELAHILLGHIDEYTPSICSLSSGQQGRLERDADDLTACLVAPLGIAHLCNISSPKELSAVFGISQEAGISVFHDLTLLREAGELNPVIHAECFKMCVHFISDRLVQR